MVPRGNDEENDPKGTDDQTAGPTYKGYKKMMMESLEGVRFEDMVITMRSTTR